MIKAVIFDLDGTLVDTERLKALAYARAIEELRRTPVSSHQVMELYKETVGQTRDVASRNLMEQLGLEEECRALMPQYGVEEPWQVLTAMRVAAYEEMTAESSVLRDNQWRHNVALLRIAHAEGCRTALATSSLTREAHQVLEALELEDQFNAVIGLDQVQRGKPDPEIYLLASQKLEVPPEECMVIEDSPAGVRAGLAAGMNVVAVATPLTQPGLHSLGALEHCWIVHEPEALPEVVQRRIGEHNRVVHHEGDQ